MSKMLCGATSTLPNLQKRITTGTKTISVPAEKGKTMGEEVMREVLGPAIVLLAIQFPALVFVIYSWLQTKKNPSIPPNVVRCKDCVYNENGCCTHSESYDDTRYRPDYFCADGERKDNV